ncbi:MAG: CvpA family protein [Lachnospiraceae bacterium]|nr:CvpA family protein [Lachnospiraceae bacterium]
MDMDIYFYLAVAAIVVIIIWRMVSGFRKGMVQEILSLIAMAVAGFCAYLLLGAIGSYLNKEIGRLIQIIILLLIVCAVYKLANLIFTSIRLVSRLPVIRSADKLLGAVFGILEGIIITGYILYWLKNWGLSVLG